MRTGRFSGHVLDRVLDGVYLLIDIEDEKIVRIRVDDFCKSYFEKLNQEYWFSEVRQYIENSFRKNGHFEDVLDFAE